MQAELITTGTELLCGKILNTNQQWICSRLFNAGIQVARQTAVPDSSNCISQAVAEALERVNVVITTGGLGPTSDDLTREAIAGLFKKELLFDEPAFENIVQFFGKRGRRPPVSTRVQAMVPEGALVLQNKNGTAPGLVLREPWKGRNIILALLPGPPRELRPMFDKLEPLLLEGLDPDEKILHRTYRSIGIGESYVEEIIKKPLATFVAEGLEVGYCAHPSAVDVRLSVQGECKREHLEAAGKVVEKILGDAVFCPDDFGIEKVVIDLLKQKRLTIATAESCTGGFVADLLTNVPGASEVFLGGFVTYSNQSKISQLNVREETLQIHGAVSEATAREMAEGARTPLSAHLAIAITGVAGPSGGTSEKPVGTVFIACATPWGTTCSQHFLPYDRRSFKEAGARHALNAVRLAIIRSV